MAQQQKNIEIEFRSRFDLAKYKELKEFLDANAEDRGEDDKDVYFFLFPNKLLKVVNNVSKNNAKIVLKLNKIGKGSDFEEIEVPITQKHFERAVKMFIALKIGDHMHSFQKRHNYLYKGVELALKWSEIWGYHLELEIVVTDQNQKAAAESKIFAVTKDLGIKIMTDEELKEFTEKAEADYKKDKKNGDS
ncbi:hypothetical protein COW09_01890 [bacterium (Candidatus Moisslbacteria) CG12_big_fil_rev_8_21_14_0_65_36_11]|nr:MAG: hypothetical protein AUK09_00810 [Parcubacteria group bacterium CG2_30_36_38]PIV45916.1 MAG: hypothetical protein COS23_01970 [bacterium (Candidatus Moisslbacteria) CG02_land_8_20_14_3_00_36_53]PIW67724.1 MAG: hypothetical protein COW09_01890 [bacterium (Candidatus Moisslbacteria) CG12_big_fil_rev_8_21_14_0_65_36_11]PIZ90165.1 MAG: hypothetical protein COX87_01955 [bacterium (Candidatus Moisslbacteria) CG_4_10_14_0_2_um_filter_36_61]PJC00646.1 MAG: hypothetical protein CO074_01185 [bact